MKKLFIHQPFFRLLSPIFSGIVIYLLILLVNNNVVQIQNEFLGQELYVCVGLSYLIQELSRLLLILFQKVKVFKESIFFLLLQIGLSILLCIGLVTLCITIYYKSVLGFSPNTEELWLFNSIFCSITVIYILLFVSHQYLHRINTEKLKEEKESRFFIEQDFKEFKEGINPDLLFESLENLLVLIQYDKDKADDFIDHLAIIYRYILSSKEKQLVSIEEELGSTNELIELFNTLPYRKVKLTNRLASSFLIVPRSLLFIIEQIIRTTIISPQEELEIVLKEVKDAFVIEYKTRDKITTPFTNEIVKELALVYSIYSIEEVIVINTDFKRSISIPKLTLKTERKL